ncbi:MAG: protein-export chaperone SecB [Chitinophagales bacterium]
MTEKARFTLSEFTIPYFTYKRPEQSQAALNISFTPTGEYQLSNGIFKISLTFQCTIEDTEVEIFSGNLIGLFKFEKPFPIDTVSIPSFFYSNSIAILFPYIRAFVSTVTLQANVGLVMLPTLNLSSLGDNLKLNTSLVE